MLTCARIRIALAVLSVCWFVNPAYTQVGSKSAGFRLTDTAGKTHTLEDYAGKVLVLEFWSFKCSVALAYEERMHAIHSRFHDRGVAFLAVASNKNESSEEIRRNAENLKVPFPVLLDPDGDLAEALDATHTPSMIVLDASGIIRYRGAIDNNKRTGENGRIAYVENALNALLAGQTVSQPETKAFGCTIRR
jgi:peroxiredoxin